MRTRSVTAHGAALVLGFTMLTGVAVVTGTAEAGPRLVCPPPQSDSWWTDEADQARAAACAKQARLRAAKRAAPTATAPAAAPSRETTGKATPPARTEFSAKEQDTATIPGIPEARFWADSVAAYETVLGGTGGTWLALSAGGEDSAFGAGLLTGLSQSGKRPDYAVVTGVSSGALLAPFAFLGSSQDAALRDNILDVNAAQVFEDRRTPESLLDTWPLREFIAKRVTPELLAAIAAEHKKGRRLIVVTTNIDAARPVAWNMGAIASAGTEASLKLFRQILAASSAIPGLFPPVIIDSEAGGKKIQEMHVDGGLAATIYVAPDELLFAGSAGRLPMTDLTVIVNGKLASEFSLTDRSLVGVLGRALSVGVKRASRSATILAAAAAKRSGTVFNLAYVDQNFDQPSRGLFDAAYMKVLFDVGLKQGRSATPFRTDLPAPPGGSQAEAPSSTGSAAR